MASGSGINGPALGALAAGGLFLYSAITHRGIAQGIHALIAGKSPATVPALPSVVPSGVDAGISDPGGQSSGPLGGTRSQNMAIGKLLAASRGWTGTEWDALVKLWDRESGWNNRARNPGSGAYGIAQALPPTKYPPEGLPPISSASAQEVWGMDYISQRYGTPSAAWAHEQQFNWY